MTATPGTALTFAKAGLPSVSNLAQALQNVPTLAGSGDTILKMDKTGHWVYGADAIDVEDGSTWAINPYSFVHGYIAWGEGEKLGEKMSSMINEALPDAGDPPPMAKRGWEPQLGFVLRCMSGEDEGLEARYGVSSVGGRRAVSNMVAEVAKKATAEQGAANPAIVPVVHLKADSYQHKQFGKIFTPIFEIMKWIPITGDVAAAPAPAAAPAAEAPAPAAAPAAEAPAPAAAEEAPRRRRRAVA